jgi:hypothetical protein
MAKNIFSAGDHPLAGQACTCMHPSKPIGTETATSLHYDREKRCAFQCATYVKLSPDTYDFCGNELDQ